MAVDLAKDVFQIAGGDGAGRECQQLVMTLHGLLHQLLDEIQSLSQRMGMTTTASTPGIETQNSLSRSDGLKPACHSGLVGREPYTPC